MEKSINLEKYQEGIFDICDFLITEMKFFLVQENRFKFRVERFYNTIKENIYSVYDKISDTDRNIYGRVLYNIRLSIYSEYKKLRRGKLSGVDSIICIILGLFEISDKYDNPDFRFKNEQKEIQSILKIMYDNIRNTTKHSKLRKLEYYLTGAIENNKWGVLSVDELDLIGIEYPREKHQEIKEEREFFDSPDNSSKEIVL